MEVRSEALPRAAASGAVCLLSGTGSGRFLGGRAGTAVSHPGPFLRPSCRRLPPRHCAALCFFFLLF